MWRREEMTNERKASERKKKCYFLVSKNEKLLTRHKASFHVERQRGGGVKKAKSMADLIRNDS